MLEPLPKSIGAVVRGFKAACTKLYKQEYFPGGDNAAQLHGDTPMPEALVHFARIFAGRGSIWQQDPATTMSAFSMLQDNCAE